MEQLKTKFNVKDFGVASKCLGLCDSQDDRGIFLHQQPHLDELLERTGLANCRPARTPMDTSISIDEKDTAPFHDSQPMRETKGSLLWLSICTRPDITVAVNSFARFQRVYTGRE
ncbi:hypothetical protein Pcac1_g4892 [Phytophthora cactorum]|nr:hypothetical protein Pcac1_g4892 [Phytophthora cactorum]